MFNIQAFLSSLAVMGKGMLGIFAVTVVIVVMMYLLVNLTQEKKESK